MFVIIITFERFILVVVIIRDRMIFYQRLPQDSKEDRWEKAE